MHTTRHNIMRKKGKDFLSQCVYILYLQKRYTNKFHPKLFLAYIFLNDNKTLVVSIIQARIAKEYFKINRGEISAGCFILAGRKKKDNPSDTQATKDEFPIFMDPWQFQESRQSSTVITQSINPLLWFSLMELACLLIFPSRKSKLHICINIMSQHHTEYYKANYTYTHPHTAPTTNGKWDLELECQNLSSSSTIWNSENS